MKAKHLFSALLISMGLTICVHASASQPQSRIIRDSTIRVVVYGLVSGNVNVQIENNDKTYYFSGSGAGQDGRITTIGNFVMTGDTFTVTANPDSFVSPAFQRITSSPTLRVETPYSTTSRVFWNEEGLHNGGEIVIFFGNY